MARRVADQRAGISRSYSVSSKRLSNRSHESIARRNNNSAHHKQLENLPSEAASCAETA